VRLFACVILLDLSSLFLFLFLFPFLLSFLVPCLVLTGICQMIEDVRRNNDVLFLLVLTLLTTLATHFSNPVLLLPLSLSLPLIAHTYISFIGYFSPHCFLH